MYALNFNVLAHVEESIEKSETLSILDIRKFKQLKLHNRQRYKITFQRRQANMMETVIVKVENYKRALLYGTEVIDPKLRRVDERTAKTNRGRPCILHDRIKIRTN